MVRWQIDKKRGHRDQCEKGLKNTFCFGSLLSFDSIISSHENEAGIS